MEKEQFGPPLVGISANIERVRELIGHVADTGLNVVVCGESGVGKEVVAQNLYRASPRFGKPFLKINCAALPDGLLESELFGHEQGAFTGADRKKRGKFELAHGGVLMLDEIGDMSLPLQSKLLHVLQSGEFSPLGSEKDVRTDAWIIAATNQELEASVRQGTFREDLYYRLNIIRIQVDPLRERPEDIPPLIEFYLERYAPRFKQAGNLQPEEQMIKALMAYHWPGNVRELQNILKRMLVMGGWSEVLQEIDGRIWAGGGAAAHSETGNLDTGPLLAEFYTPDGNPNLNGNFSLKEVKRRAVEKIEREVISYVLKQTGWNRSKATKILKISYKTLLYKISELGIEPPGNGREKG